MIIEQYVSFETAKLLKEKGFKGKGAFFYDSLGKLHSFDPWWWYITPKERYDAIDCSTQSLVMRWLREVHHILVSIEVYCIVEHPIWCYKYYNLQKDYICVWHGTPCPSINARCGEICSCCVCWFVIGRRIRRFGTSIGKPQTPDDCDCGRQ